MSLKNVVLGIAIVILTISVVAYGINTFYEAPDYEKFCGEFDNAPFIDDRVSCESVGGKWTAYSERSPKPDAAEGYCDRDFYCREDYEVEREAYSRVLFVITLVLGIAILVVGGFLFSLEAVGAGLMGGGVGVILYGVGAYWRYSGDVLRFILSLLGLAAVIYLAYWMNGKTGRKKSKK